MIKTRTAQWDESGLTKLEELKNNNSLNPKEQDLLKSHAHGYATVASSNISASHVTSAWNYLVTREML